MPGPQTYAELFVFSTSESAALNRTLREHLRAAGLERDDLYSNGDHKRTGHKSEELLRYRQAANALAELELIDVAPLFEAIPELATLTDGPGPGPGGGPRSLEAATEAAANSPVIPTLCARKGSNLHALRRRNLNPVRLPIPPLARGPGTIVGQTWLRKSSVGSGRFDWYSGGQQRAFEGGIGLTRRAALGRFRGREPRFR